MAGLEPRFFFTENRAGVEEVLHGPEGPVIRHFLERAMLIKEAARVQLRRTTRYSTGELERSLYVRYARMGEHDGFVIGSNSPHAYFVHEGTKPHVITPRTATVLRWVGSDGSVVYARSVNHPGSPPNHFLSDNLPIAVGRSPLAPSVMARTSTGGLYITRGRF
jgi:hypothetical protein